MVNTTTEDEMNEKYKFNPSNNAGIDNEGQFQDWDFNSFIEKLDNPLFEYENCTHRFTLYTVSKSDYVRYTESPENGNFRKYIIAKSGVSGRYNINRVVMDGYPPASGNFTTNYTYQKIEIDLIEQGGMSLFDDINVLSRMLGYQEFPDIPLILDMDFIGYKNGTPTVIRDLSRSWLLSINKIPAKMDDNIHGTRYTIHCVTTSSPQNNIWTLRQPYTLNGISTFGGFLQNLQDHINNELRKENSYLQFNRLKEFGFLRFKIDPEIADLPIISAGSLDADTTGSTTSSSSASKDFSWEAGTPLSRIVDDVLDHTDAKAAAVDNSAGRVFAHMIPISKFLGYDNFKMKMVFATDIYIINYHVFDSVTAEDTDLSKLNMPKLMKMIAAYNKGTDETDGEFSKRHMKVYDYTYSGLNDSILRLDIKFNQQYNIAINRNMSALVSLNNSGGQNTQTNAGADFNQMERLAIIANNNMQGNAITERIADYIFTPTIEKATERVDGIQSDVEEETTNLLGSSTKDFYIEDIRELQGIDDIYKTHGLHKNVKVPLEFKNTKTNAGGANSTNETTEVIDKRLARDNYYNSSFMVSLDMRIKGDPHWLGYGYHSRLNQLESIINNKTYITNDFRYNTARFLTHEELFLLNIQPVPPIGESTGILDKTLPSFLNQTIYRIVRVKSIFENGDFYQDLTAAIIMRSLNKSGFEDSIETGDIDE